MGRQLCASVRLRKDTVANSNSNARRDRANVSVMDTRLIRRRPIQSSPWARARVGAPFCTPRIRSGRKCRSTRVSASSPMIRRISRLTPRGAISPAIRFRIRAATTKEYVFVITTLRDRLKFKVDWYKTTDNNATLAGEAGAGFATTLLCLGAPLLGGDDCPGCSGRHQQLSPG